MMRCSAAIAALTAGLAAGGACSLSSGSEGSDELDHSQQAIQAGASTEFQVRRGVFEDLLARSLQQKISEQCLDPIDGTIVDHIDIAPVPNRITLSQTSPTTIAIAAILDIFVVDRAAVLATPNGVPPGAASPVGRAVLNLDMTVANGSLNIAYKNLDLGAFAGQLSDAQRAALEAQVKSGLGALPSQDLKPMLGSAQDLAGLGHFDLNAQNLTIQFGLLPGGNRLDGSQTWGAFMSGAVMEQMVAVTENRSGMTITSAPEWHPDGTLPRVENELRISMNVPDPFAGTAEVFVHMRTDFAVVNSGVTLRSTTHWEFESIQLHTDLPGFVEAAVEDFAHDYAEQAVAGALDPAGRGGTRIDDRTFYKDKALPTIRFAGAWFYYASALASPDGMTLGGPVTLPEAPEIGPLDATIRPFDGFDSIAWFSCPVPSVADQKVFVDQVTATASVRLAAPGGAKVCGVEYVPADPFLQSHTTISDDKTGVGVRLPAAATPGYPQALQLLLRTSRGTRLFDIGTPPKPVVDESGHVTNVRVQAIDTCLKIDIDLWNFMHGDGPFVPPPPPNYVGIESIDSTRLGRLQPGSTGLDRGAVSPSTSLGRVGVSPATGLGRGGTSLATGLSRGGLSAPTGMDFGSLALPL